jgi:hypothetical protein
LSAKQGNCRETLIRADPDQWDQPREMIQGVVSISVHERFLSYLLFLQGSVISPLVLFFDLR